MFKTISKEKDKNSNEQFKLDSQAQAGKVVTFINFTADGCLPCQRMEVLMRELKQKYSNVVEVKELDIYENYELANKYNIAYTPTQVFLDSDGKVLEMHQGFLGKSKIIDIIKKYGVDI